MFHVYRVLFAGFLVAALVLTATWYSSSDKSRSVGKRLAPSQEQNADLDIDPSAFMVQVAPIPPGMTSRGTSFPLGQGLWLTARHIVGVNCKRIILVINGMNVPAEIRFLDPDADLAVLYTPELSMPALPLETKAMTKGQEGFAFGFPHGSLGATEARLVGRTHMRLGGHISGTAPVLTWAELRRYPESHETLTGISGGPMLDKDGKVVGIIVAASYLRDKNYTVAPEILREIEDELGLLGSSKDQVAAPDVVDEPVSLENSASAMSNQGSIALTYCIVD